MSEITGGELWNAFGAAILEARETLLSPGSPDTEFDQAEGARYLSRLIRLGLEIYVESGDADFPRFYQPSHETAKMGGDNPDNLYLSATIEGDREYRISGNVGTVAYLSIGSKANRYAVDGTMASTGEIGLEQFQADSSGKFEVIASAKEPEGGTPWLPLQPDSTMIHLRQTFLDRRTEVPASVDIKRISDGPDAPGPDDPQVLAERLLTAARFVAGTSKLFAGWAAKFMTRPNELLDWGQDMFVRAGGDPEIFYIHGYWRLAAGEALVIETEVPDCEHWNIQVNNWWMESLDYRYHDIWVNKKSARLGDDGRATMVIAHSDPGFGNWLSTAGHDQGFALLRWVKAQHHPLPRCRVIKNE